MQSPELEKFPENDPFILLSCHKTLHLSEKKWSPIAALSAWRTCSKTLSNLYWISSLLIITQHNNIKPEWTGHGFPFLIWLFPKEWTTLPLRRKQRTHSETVLKAWSYCCLYFHGQRHNSIGFKGLFFYLPFWQASAGRRLPSIPTCYKWKPRGGSSAQGHTLKQSQTHALTLIWLSQIWPNSTPCNFLGPFKNIGHAFLPMMSPPSTGVPIPPLHQLYFLLLLSWNVCLHN